MDHPQQANAAWWSSNPMTYDWAGEIRAAEGSPEFFRQVDRRAIEAHRPFAHPRFPDEAAYGRLIDWNRARNRRVLEIGCGMGLHASLFSKAGARLATMDLTQRAVRLVRRRLDQDHLEGGVVHADGEKLPFADGVFDQVWSWGVIHHSARTEAIVREIFRVLKPGGLLQLMVYHRSSVRYWVIGGVQHGILKGKLLRMNLAEVNQTFTDGAIARHYTRREMRELLRDFSDVRCRILQEAGSEALPKISPILRRLTPSLAARFDRWINARWGWFLFAEATRP